MHRLFVYGTLQIPEVVEAVIGRLPAGTEASLPGYACYRVRGERYPGVVPEPESRTPGIVYKDISDEELRRLDLFEGEMYGRQRVQAILGNQSLSAWVYVVKDAYRKRLCREAWYLRGFIENGLQSFMKSFVEDRRHLYRSEGGE